MATFQEKKTDILDFMKSKGGKTSKTELDAYKKSIGVVSDPNLTTMGKVKEGQMGALQQAISSGQSGKEFISEPSKLTAQPKAPSISQNLKDQSAANTESLVAAIKRNVANAQTAQQKIISDAPQAFDPLRAQSEVMKSQDLRGALERSSNLGDRGGIGRSEALATQTAGGNRLSAINLQQQNIINDANAEIARLESEGSFQEAQAVANQKAQLLQALSNEQIRQEGLTLQDEIRQEGIATREQEQLRQDFGVQVMSRYNDLQAFANELRSQESPQWQIDQVLATRQQKIAEQGLDQQGNKIIEPTLGGGGGTGGTSGNLAQFNTNYNELANSLKRGRMSPNESLAYIASQREKLVTNFGEDVVSQMEQDLYAQANQQPMSEEDRLIAENTMLGLTAENEAFKTQPEEVADESEAVNAGFTAMMESANPKQWLEKERPFMTISEYNQLKKVLDGLEE